MTMKECYLDALDWLSQHPRNAMIIRVKSDSELRKYTKYFQEQLANDLFADENAFDRIEWRIDSLVS